MILDEHDADLTLRARHRRRLDQDKLRRWARGETRPLPPPVVREGRAAAATARARRPLGRTCPACGAEPGHPCVGLAGARGGRPGHVMRTYHAERAGIGREVHSYVSREGRPV